MNKVTILATTRDLRTDTMVVYAQIKLKDYINLVGTDFDRFEIQRPRQNFKAYERMKRDIVNGALLPTITLAINPKMVADALVGIGDLNYSAFESVIDKPDNLYILDGLQRTYIINDLIESSTLLKDQDIHLEFWLEPKIKHLIYRLIILNAGQKPMSMRHQLDLLFMTLNDLLVEKIPGLELSKEKDETRRNKPKKFTFDRIVAGYYCFLTKNQEVKRENIIVTQLNEEDILDLSEDDINQKLNDFIDQLRGLSELDELTYHKYNQSRLAGVLSSPQNWFSEENSINTFFAAISLSLENESFKERLNPAFAKLKVDLGNPEIEDPLFLEDLQSIRSGINPQKKNIGTELRKILFTGFREFIRSEGGLNLGQCWRLGAS